MDYTGLINKFKINRPLTDEERKLQLKQKERLDIKPNYFCATVKLNSTFLEVVDKYYGWKGYLTTGLFFIIAVGIGLCLLAAELFFIDGLFSTSADRFINMIYGSVPLLMCLALFTALIWLLGKECFRYTHYPIRLQRKTRMVHVCRLNGTQFSVPWDKVFFTVGRAARPFGRQNWDIRGHVLDADGATVRETFAFALTCDMQSELVRYWEYVRRYMEEGPESIVPFTPFYLPISDHRETWLFGLLRLALNCPGQTALQIIISPALFLFSLGRWIAMHTCRIPAWSKEIENACPIEPNDPCKKDARDNPPKSWKVM